VIACGSATRARRSRAARGKESRQRYSRKAVLREWCGMGRRSNPLSVVKG
jgi:hypothetical protein